MIREVVGAAAAIERALRYVAMKAEDEWPCIKCGEAVPAYFDVCWNCGADRSGTPDPSFRLEVGFTPQCKACGYLLYGLPSAICPECGSPFDPTEKDTIRDIS